MKTNHTLEITHSHSVITPKHSSGRYDFIDVARGILIILVVIGHSSFPFSEYIYWFHMPAFFLISGLLHVQPNYISTFLSKRFFNLVVPYLTLGIIIWIINYSFYIDKWELKNFVRSFAGFVYMLLFWGGEVLKGNFAVFWFINCFLFTVVSFTLAKRWINKDIMVMLLAALGFILGYVLNQHLERPLPWAINVVPYAFAYFTIGYYGKNILKSLASNSFLFAVILLVLCSSLIYFGISSILYLKVDLKYGIVSNPVLGLLIPVLFTIAVLKLSVHISHTRLKKFLILIGQNTLLIMYLHIVLNFMLHQITGEVTPSFLFLLTGVLIPHVLALLFKRSELTSMLFLGNNSKGLLNLTAQKLKIKSA